MEDIWHYMLPSTISMHSIYTTKDEASSNYAQLAAWHDILILRKEYYFYIRTLCNSRSCKHLILHSWFHPQYNFLQDLTLIFDNSNFFIHFLFYFCKNLIACFSCGWDKTANCTFFCLCSFCHGIIRKILKSKTTQRGMVRQLIFISLEFLDFHFLTKS